MKGAGRKAARADARSAAAAVDATAAAGGAAAAGAGPAGMRLACRGVTFSYEEGREAVPAVRDVGFELAAGGSLALLGASGAGKSTLLQLVRGLDGPEAGAVVLDGVEPGGEGYAALRREIGLVFQIPELQLFAPSAREDVAFGPRRLRWSDERVSGAVSAALELVGLPEEKFGDRHPYALSGGEQRRLALAGVLAMQPRLLLLDEPFVSLDPGTRRQLAEILGRLKDAGVTIILATHDVDLAWTLCDEALVLSDGAVAASGAWEFDAAAIDLLVRNRLREPQLVELWRRLGRDLATAPRTAAEAAEALA
jgi:energy-coupling factor transporter ATP-binding protein EcfA2